MRKFKLIREYPNSPKIGTIAEKKDEHSCYHLSDIFHQPLNSVCIENYPEFWEEVKEEFPKIISFRKTDASKYVINLTNRDNYNGWSLNGMLHAGECVDSGDFEIYQVAVSETEVFTLGDKVEIIMNRPKYSKSTISRFELETNGCISVRVSEYCSVSLHDIKKAPEVLFVTEDGIEIFKGDKFYYISIRNPNPVCHSGYAQEESAMNTNYKYFSTIEAAKKYIDENKPIYSKKQIEEALNYGTYIFVDVELLKSRLGL
jgi:hypothetical protein